MLKQLKRVNFPLIDGRSHFICALREGATGRFDVMVNRKVTSSDELTNATSIAIPTGSTLVLGNNIDKRSIRGLIGRVNVWDTLLDKHCIVAMYHGNGRERGSVVSWEDLKNVIPRRSRVKTLLHIEEQHKGKRSEFAMDFKPGSSQNVANHTFIFQELNKVTACAWFKTKEQETIFQYLSTYNSSRHNFLVLVIAGGNLGYKVGSQAIQNATNLYVNDDQWHHVCLWWRKSDRETSIHCDGERIVRIRNIHKGQYMDESTRRFIAGQEFVGKITEVNVWGKTFVSDIANTMSRDCRSGGGQFVWSAFRNTYHGDVQLIESSECLLPEFIVLSRRDERCNEKYLIKSLSCRGAMKALFDGTNSTSGKMWRCYHECALIQSSIDGSYIFNQTCGSEECITDAHNDLLTIT